RVVVRAPEHDHLGIGPRAGEQADRDQIVVHDHVRGGETLLGAAREQTRVTGSRADQVDAALHLPRMSLAPCASKRSARRRPSPSASSAGALAVSSSRRLPSTSETIPWSETRPAATVAWAARGVLQSPSIVAWKARSAATAIAVSLSSIGASSERVA